MICLFSAWALRGYTPFQTPCVGSGMHSDGNSVMLFAGKMPRVEVRRMNENGQVVVGNVTEYTAQLRPGSSSSGSSSAYASDWTDENERDDDEDYAEGDFGEDRGAGQSWERSDVSPILLYLHEVITIHSAKFVKSSHCTQSFLTAQDCHLIVIVPLFLLVTISHLTYLAVHKSRAGLASTSVVHSSFLVFQNSQVRFSLISHQSLVCALGGVSPGHGRVFRASYGRHGFREYGSDH